jgi:hypothetical protein
MAKKEMEISEEIKSMTFDIDYGTYEFQKNFYKKFLLIRNKKVNIEAKSNS